VSPSVQSFMYDRNKPSELSTFLPEENNIAEEDENVLEEEMVPHLSDLDQARLNSCVEEVQNVIGDAVPLKVIQNAVCQFNFDVKKSLDAVLNLQETSLSRVKGETGIIVKEVINTGLCLYSHQEDACSLSSSWTRYST